MEAAWSTDPIAVREERFGNYKFQKSGGGGGAGGGGSLVVQKSCDRKSGPVGVVTGKTSDWCPKLKARRELKEIFYCLSARTP